MNKIIITVGILFSIILGFWLYAEDNSQFGNFGDRIEISDSVELKVTPITDKSNKQIMEDRIELIGRRLAEISNLVEDIRDDLSTGKIKVK